MAVTTLPHFLTASATSAASPGPVDLESSMPARFRQVAAWRPAHPALISGDRTYSYGELDTLTEVIAAGLAAVINEPGARIPLLFAAGEAATLLSIFGVLKAGGAYTGLGPNFPLERNRAIWEDSDPVALLTDRQHAALALDITQDQRPVFLIEELLEAAAAPPPPLVIAADQMAVLFYTSGSTGRPKGIERSHRQFLMRAARPPEDTGQGPDARLIMSRFIGYAASGGVYGGLLSGATIYSLDLQSLSPTELIDFVRREAITSFSLPISVFRQLVEEVDGRLDLPYLRRLRLGGEALLKSDVDAYQRHFPLACTLSHGFSASELGGGTRLTIDHATVITTPRVPVGKPQPGTEILLWDENGQPVPQGEAGEIVVRSRYHSRGYWRNPELTHKVFLPDPAGGDWRLYRTGDMGRWLPDGNLMHLGRKDQMVKIRGFRIEPGEVELALKQVNPQFESAVIAREREPGELELVAFVVPHGGAAFSPLELRRGLTAILPVHTLPARFVRLDAWPLTTSGKVDRQLLKQMALPPAEPSETYVPPAGDQERQLAGLWESVLKVAPIGRDDNFFDIGGHSLAAIALLARVAKTTGQSLPMTALFEVPTVAQMAALLRGESRARKLPKAIVTFNPLGDRLPLFLLPELESSAMNLIKLIRHLGVARPVYGLQPRGFEDGLRPFGTIPDTAAYYVEAIRAVRPHGPYHLAGICYGGVVAYEVARQLRAQGERVAALCLIDVPGVRPAGAGWRESLSRALQGIQRRLNLWRAFTGERLRPHLRPERVARDTTRRMYDEQGRLQPGRRLRYAQSLTSLRYRPLPYDGAADVIRCSENEQEGALRGWPQLIRGGLRTQVVPGTNHQELLSKVEHMRATGNWLLACLEQADPHGRAPGDA